MARIVGTAAGERDRGRADGQPVASSSAAATFDIPGLGVGGDEDEEDDDDDDDDGGGGGRGDSGLDMRQGDGDQEHHEQQQERHHHHHEPIIDPRLNDISKAAAAAAAAAAAGGSVRTLQSDLHRDAEESVQSAVERAHHEQEQYDAHEAAGDDSFPLHGLTLDQINAATAAGASSEGGQTMGVSGDMDALVNVGHDEDNYRITSQARRPKLVTSLRERQRITKACETCAHRKRKCDGVTPECGPCALFHSNCRYSDSSRKRGPPKGYRFTSRAAKGTSGEDHEDMLNTSTSGRSGKRRATGSSGRIKLASGTSRTKRLEMAFALLISDERFDESTRQSLLQTLDDVGITDQRFLYPGDEFDQLRGNPMTAQTSVEEQPGTMTDAYTAGTLAEITGSNGELKV